MIQLEKTFVSGEGGFNNDPLTYTQVERSETAAVYERSRNGLVKDYEVFNIKVRPKGTKIFQLVTEDDIECYPSTAQFGFNAWSYTNKGAALKRFKELDPVAKAEAKAKDKIVFVLPDKDFTVNDVAELNKSNYISAANFVKTEIAAARVKLVREERRNVKGQMTKIYGKM